MPAMQGVPNHVAAVKMKVIDPNVFGSVFVLPLKRKSQEEHSLTIDFRLKSTVFTQIQFLTISGSTYTFEKNLSITAFRGKH